MDGLLTGVQRLLYGSEAVDAAQRRRMQPQISQQQFQELLGQKPVQYQPGISEYPVLPQEGTGLLGGQMQPQEFAARMMAIPGYEQIGAQLFQQAQPKARQMTTEMQNLQAMGLQPGTHEYTSAMERMVFPGMEQKPTLTEVGVGKGMKQKAYVSPAGITNLIGQPYGEKKPMTEGQAKASLYGSRAEEADQTLRELRGQYSRKGIMSASRLEDWPMVGESLAASARAAMSPETQRAEQAQRNFINAVLRQESGAVISPAEFSNALKQYFPQPGDSAEVIKQKAQNRQTAIAGLKKIAGEKYKRPKLGEFIAWGKMPGIMEPPPIADSYQTNAVTISGRPDGMPRQRTSPTMPWEKPYE